jgi:hypothetical protein
MTQPLSKPRQQAEIAFGKTQSEFFAREKVVAAPGPGQAQAEKTLRLREARLAREVMAAPTPKGAK